MDKLEIRSDYCNYTCTSITRDVLYRKTIEVWDILCEAGHRPANISCGVVTMHRREFFKLIQEYGGRASIQEKRGARVSAVWIGPVEICFTEIFNESNEWVLDENWEPLDNQY